jgi:hypothetical protein
MNAIASPAKKTNRSNAKHSTPSPPAMPYLTPYMSTGWTTNGNKITPSGGIANPLKKITTLEAKARKNLLMTSNRRIAVDRGGEF